jgi:hypothetical protein
MAAHLPQVDGLQDVVPDAVVHPDAADSCQAAAALQARRCVKEIANPVQKTPGGPTESCRDAFPPTAETADVTVALVVAEAAGEEFPAAKD